MNKHPLAAHEAPPERDRWLQQFRTVRATTLALTDGLSAEDQCVQSMPDASPAKWHLAHTTWFFEAVVLARAGGMVPLYDPDFHYLFNSYYEALGPRHPRPQRGLLTRPGLDAVHAYRRHVDAAVERLIVDSDDVLWADVQPLVLLGLHHEQQHQELLVTDALHLLSCHPLLPTWKPASAGLRLAEPETPMGWIDRPGGIVSIGRALSGADGPHDFAFDNETPAHPVLLQPYAIADRLVSCGDFLQFIEDGGYRRPEFWLSDGWAAVRAGGWQAPAYWLAPDDPRNRAGRGWQVFGLQGVRPLDPAAPASQLSFYEAAAYAEWAGARLPTEHEWEAAFDAPGVRQMQGAGWQWTRSSYDPYPGFRPLPGVAAEYNGKFMVGQLVLRGGSVATPEGHTRPTSRNFFPPAARWQFTGLRLAKDATP
ncbi:ergothioneine biosynthesis protein EgtB [uncultured Xylophilus sp.]|uniref:ergothioneine biosynthesis protein EgtB n=1 Tax=uncultured Xylophilus sp. TaxID=296832 RepID=UPI0025DA4F93|nr:ergothioneine biosynthesis protein EgtB [uncultured Xylophilus sp.]